MNKRRNLTGILFTLALLLTNASSTASTSAQSPDPSSRTFPETGKTVSGPFLQYWDTHGGLSQQGYPISDEMQERSEVNGQTYTVQYFERAVFELHPENQPPYDVLLSLLGVMRYHALYPYGTSDHLPDPSANTYLSPETGKRVGGIFLEYWQRYGGLAQNGYPISGEFTEINPLDGNSYTVQYFERAVFEFHPENPSPYNVLLTQLGRLRYLAREGDKAAYPGISQAVTLAGGGSTTLTPLLSKWSQEYNKLYSNVKVQYQSVGSRGGRINLLDKQYDFAAVDQSLTDTQLAQFGVPNDILHIPLPAAGVAIAYNLAEFTQSSARLNLTGPVLADIFLCKITRWNDPAIAVLNVSESLPDIPIQVIHYTEDNAATYAFSDYLSTVSPEWNSQIGRNTSVKFPCGIGSQGDSPPSDQVRYSRGGIAYMHFAYAATQKLNYALMQNKAGKFVGPMPENVTAAGAGLGATIPADLRFSFTDTPGPKSYPIVMPTWALVYTQQPDPIKGKALAYFLWWAIHQGQDYSTSFYMAPLAPLLTERTEAQIRRMTCGSAPCFP